MVNPGTNMGKEMMEVYAYDIAFTYLKLEFDIYRLYCPLGEKSLKSIYLGNMFLDITLIKSNLEI